MAQALVDDESAVLEAEESRCSAEAKLLKGTAPSVLWAPDKRADTCRAFRAAPQFVLLDFRHAACAWRPTSRATAPTLKCPAHVLPHHVNINPGHAEVMCCQRRRVNGVMQAEGAGCPPKLFLMCLQGNISPGVRAPELLRMREMAKFACADRPCWQRRNVDGLDATSAQTFGTLWSILIRLGVELVITELDSPKMQALLVAHDVIGEASCVYASCILPCLL